MHHGLFSKLQVNYFSCKQELQTQGKTGPAQSFKWWRTQFKCKIDTALTQLIPHDGELRDVRHVTLLSPLLLATLATFLK